MSSNQNQSFKLVQLVIGIVLVSVLTLAVTAYSAMLTGRWSQFSGYPEAQKLLRELPLRIDDWEAEKEGTLATADAKALEIENGYITRTYRNVHSQNFVNLTIMVGKTGRVSVHTPEICFGGKNYEKEDQRTVVPISIKKEDGDSTEDQFWKVNFNNKASSGGTISFYYGISSGKNFEALEDPRFAFRRYRYVYKLQAESITDNTTDNLKQFMIDCLPTIHQHMRDCE